MKCTVDGCELEVTAKGLCYRHYMRLRRTGKLTTRRLTGDFWSKVRRGPPEDCWPWIGFTRDSGHGLTSHKGLPMHTSRKAWLLANGPIPRGLCVCHKCDNKICCNPAHLYLGTPADNILDHHEKPPFEKRGPRGRATLLTEEQLARLWRMRRSGLGLEYCANYFGVHMATICKYITAIRKAKLEQNRQSVRERSSAI